MTDRSEVVLSLWCHYTGIDPTAMDAGDRRAFLTRPQVAQLADVPDEVLRDAADYVRRGLSLPLERWLAGVRVVRPTYAGYSASSAYTGR